MKYLKPLLGGLLVLASYAAFAQQATPPNQSWIPKPAFELPKPATLTMPSVVGFSPYGTSSGFPSMHPSVVSAPTLTTNRQGIPERARRQMQLLQQRRELLRQSAQNTYSFPEVPQETAATKPYHQAYQTLQAMLGGNQKLRLADAVFSVENAFYQGQLSRQAFDEALAHYAQLSLRWLQAQGLDADSPTARLYGLQKLFTDTLKVPAQGEESMQVHYPFDYDFEDFWGRQDYTKQFVSKLLATGSGQCYSLPTLFLLLAEQLGVEARLAFSPQHSFIKFRDAEGQWHNFETTTGHLVSDAWVMGSGYVTADAVRNKMYLEPLDTRQVIAHKMADLAHSYRRKFGPRPFVKKAVETSLSHLPNNIFALKVKANYQTDLVNWLWNIRGRPDRATFEADPRLRAALKKRNSIYSYIDATGFQPIPEKAYNKWLESVDEQQAQQKEEQQYLRLTKESNN